MRSRILLAPQPYSLPAGPGAVLQADTMWQLQAAGAGASCPAGPSPSLLTHLRPLLQALLPLPVLQLLQRIFAPLHLALVEASEVVPAAGGSLGAHEAGRQRRRQAAQPRRRNAAPGACVSLRACRAELVQHACSTGGAGAWLGTHLCAFGSNTTSSPLSRCLCLMTWFCCAMGCRCTHTAASSSRCRLFLLAMLPKVDCDGKMSKNRVPSCREGFHVLVGRPPLTLWRCAQPARVPPATTCLCGGMAAYTQPIPIS